MVRSKEDATLRKLILQMQTSVDGYVADKNRKTDWLLWNWDDEWSWDNELREYFNLLVASVDCILLSSKMVEDPGFIDHWAAMAEHHDNPQSGFARKIKEAHKVVFTRT